MDARKIYPIGIVARTRSNYSRSSESNLFDDCNTGLGEILLLELFNTLIAFREWMRFEHIEEKVKLLLYTKCPLKSIVNLGNWTSDRNESYFRLTEVRYNCCSSIRLEVVWSLIRHCLGLGFGSGQKYSYFSLNKKHEKDLGMYDHFSWYFFYLNHP